MERKYEDKTNSLTYKLSDTVIKNYISQLKLLQQTNCCYFAYPSSSFMIKTTFVPWGPWLMNEIHLSSVSTFCFLKNYIYFFYISPLVHLTVPTNRNRNKFKQCIRYNSGPMIAPCINTYHSIKCLRQNNLSVVVQQTCDETKLPRVECQSLYTSVQLVSSWNWFGWLVHWIGDKY